MKWFLAKLVFEIICGDGSHSAQFDEQLRLITAQDDKHAMEIARNIGVEETVSFENAANLPVQWKFMGVAELISLQPEYHGAEVFSRIIETNFAEGYLNLFRNQSEQLNNSL